MAAHLFTTDRQLSVLPGLHVYSPYGFIKTSAAPALGFCGQHRDPSTGSYPLGNGRRFYNPILMRFMKPDAFSPFAKGGINAYGYCSNDPVNFTDPSGQFLQYAGPVRSILNGVVNLGVTAYKYLRDMRITRRYFASDPENAGSRQGHLATGTIESELPRLDWKQKVLMGVGGSTAMASIGTGVARLAGATSDTLLFADFVAGSVATTSSIVEVGQLVSQQLDARYPIGSAEGNFHAAAPSPTPEREWRFASGPTPSRSPVSRRRSMAQIFFINERQRSTRETAV
ncbi:hypothetical protein BLX42_03285 [Pseudomonas sp. SG-MS2]|uniref:RHS repeat-associated core domain-containing protein n=1 Tax=Pseudomonas putida TaxID=303 RepID=A0A7Y7ZEI3_PSEPU|nr:MULTISPECIES: RHS repeat-associated core domain-containing protein [Pseudomonas]KAF1312469.1 hypothetical protein BLX42_03285 [Pseudomonas sp. SG-MS2]NWC82575.1 RHS repeat-associated core domain-containing protein [Pseudomonas putida]